MDILSFKGSSGGSGKGNKHNERNWGIPLFFFRNHLNGRTRNRRTKFGGVLTDEENVAIVRWIFTMQ